MNTQLVQDLEAARAKIVQGWTQGGNAEDARGYNVAPHDDSAVRWCARGAILSVTKPACWSYESGRYIAAIEAFRDCAGSTVIDYNDDDKRTKKEVLAVFDKAIAKAKES